TDGLTALDCRRKTALTRLFRWPQSRAQHTVVVPYTGSIECLRIELEGTLKVFLRNKERFEPRLSHFRCGREHHLLGLFAVFFSEVCASVDPETDATDEEQREHPIKPQA